MTTVFISGATGFIAQHIVKLLIQKGYAVIGSVRTAEKGERLKSLVNSPKFSYVIVPDIGAAGAFDKAFESHPEITVVLHTASPFTYKVKDPEKDLLIPAVEGTKNVLKATKVYAPQVTRIVITSSFAAITSFAEASNKSYIADESAWNNISWEKAKSNVVESYCASKAFAEKAAWKFVETENPNFILSVINPTFVFGPQAYDADVKFTMNTSSEVINALLKTGPNETPVEYYGGYIDVRDVAAAHIAAFENDNTKYQRLILSSGSFVTQDILDIINGKFPTLRGKVPLGRPGTGSELVKNLARIDNKKTREILGFRFRTLEESVVDSINQILSAKETEGTGQL